MATQPKTLDEYYTSKGMALPKLSSRAVDFQQYGLGNASAYQGTVEQNTALLGKLLAGPAPAAPAAAAQATPGALPVQQTSSTTPMAVPTSPAYPQPLTAEQITSLFTTPTAAQTSALNERATINKGYNDILSRLGQQSAQQARLLNDAGVPGLQKQLDEVNNQIRQINSSAFSAFTNSEDRLAPMFAITGEQAQIERQRSAKTYGLAAMGQLFDGQIARAKESVQSALDAEFKPLLAQAQYYENMLKLNSDTMDRADQQAAAERAFKLQQYKESVDQQQKNKEYAVTKGLEALSNNPGSKAAQLAYNEVLNLNTNDPQYLQKVAQLLAPYAGKPYTLSQGESIYSSSGQRIAYNPKVDTSVPLPANYGGQFASTIDVVSNRFPQASQRAQIKSGMQSAVAAGDYPSAYQYVIQATGSGLTAENRTKLENATIDNLMLKGLQAKLEALSNAGYNTNLLTGTADEIQKKLGVLSTDSKYASVAGELDRFFQQYRQNMTGAAFGAKETSEYAKVLPSKSNTLALNLSLINGALNYNDAYVTSAIKSTVGQGGVYIKEYAEGATPQSANQDAGGGDQQFSQWLRDNGLMK